MQNLSFPLMYAESLIFRHVCRITHFYTCIQNPSFLRMHAESLISKHTCRIFAIKQRAHMIALYKAYILFLTNNVLHFQNHAILPHQHEWFFVSFPVSIQNRTTVHHYQLHSEGSKNLTNTQTINTIFNFGSVIFYLRTGKKFTGKFDTFLDISHIIFSFSGYSST